MKRFHIHIGVEKLEEAIRFYRALFGAAPVKTKPDYAKWMLDDPRVNCAISTRTCCVPDVPAQFIGLKPSASKGGC